MFLFLISKPVIRISDLISVKYLSNIGRSHLIETDASFGDLNILFEFLSNVSKVETVAEKICKIKMNSHHSF